MHSHKQVYYRNVCYLLKYNQQIRRKKIIMIKVWRRYYIQYIFDKGDIEKLTLSNILMWNICESFASRLGWALSTLLFNFALKTVTRVTRQEIHEMSMWEICEKLQVQINEVIRLSWQWQPTLVLLPAKSHGWRSLVGCSPWGR